MQAANQFTPDQLIVAGRRAEAQGQPAYALQFYRYVADHFPASTEAYEARDALFRLAPPPVEPVSQRQPATGYAAPTHQHTHHQPPQHAGHGELRAHADPVVEPAPRMRSERGKAKARAAPAETYEAPLRPARGYRVGRIVAAMLNTIGWLSLVGSIAMIPLLIMSLTVKAFPKGLKDAIAGNLVAFCGGTFGVLLVGLFAVFAAQVARATFDTADATRALYDANTGSE